MLFRSHGDTGFGDTITATFVVTGSTATPTPLPGPGGRGFGITSGNSVTMTWSPGTEQIGYLVVRISGGRATILPPSGTLPTSATSFTDTAALSEVTCYVLAVFGPAGSTFISDVLCLFPNTRVGSFPRNVTIRLNQSSTASFTWDPPASGGQTKYVLTPLGGSPITLPGSASSASHTMAATAAVTCYTLAAATDTATLGTADILCGIPGITTLR